MKKVLLILFACISMYCNAQEEHSVFCEIVGTQKFMSLKLNVEVDFGQGGGTYYNTLVDEEGKKITFSSMVDALNYMGNAGWTFVQAYVVTHGSQNVYHYMLTKKVKDGEDAKGNLRIRQDSKPRKEKHQRSNRDDMY